MVLYKDDLEFAIKCYSGNESDMDEFTTKYWEVIQNGVKRYIRNYGKIPGNDSEEICHQVYEKIISNNFEKLKTYKGTGKLCDWIYVLIINHIIDLRRKNSKISYFSPIPDDDKPNVFLNIIDSKQNILDDTIIRDDVETLKKLLSMLDERSKLIIELKYIRKLTQKQIAGILKIKPGTAGSEISRTMDELKDLSRKYGIID